MTNPLRRYTTLEYAEALMLGGEKAYQEMSNLEGLYTRGFRERFGAFDFIHPQLGIRVTRDVLDCMQMLPALDAMIARKRRELGL